MKVEDIKFESADHVIKEIKDMNVKGGSPFGRSAAWAFKLACENEELNNQEDMKKRFNEIKNQMIELKPTMATIHNTCSLVEKTMNDNLNNENIKTNILKCCDKIIDYSFKAVDKVSEYGSEYISNGDKILMHSYSSTLMGIFIMAKNKGKKFSVICTESRPLRESRNAVNILTALGVDVTFVSDASVFEFMKECDYIIMGADTIAMDGSVANKMGTYQISVLAQACNIPVFIASELYKTDPRTQEGYKVQLERRTKWELVQQDDFKDMENVTIINQFFDYTPYSYITNLITEFGFINPSSVSKYWNKIECELLGKGE